VYPPDAFLQDRPVPKLEGDTYRALAVLAAKQRAELDKYIMDKQLLRKWKKEMLANE